MKRKRNIGRPRAEDPRVHLPNVVIQQTTLVRIIRLAKETDKYLSYHINRALNQYIESIKKN